MYSFTSIIYAMVQNHRYKYIYIRIYYNIYIYARPPPQDLLVASFCLPKVLPESFLHNLKEKQKKQKKTRNNPKKKTEGHVSARVSSESFLFFFVFFDFYGCFGHILEKNTFHYWPFVFTISLRKRLFPKYFRQFILNFFL